jgi:peptide/nickel transport system substrate-binding protein
MVTKSVPPPARYAGTLLLLATMLACTAPQPSRSDNGIPPIPQSAGAPKRIVAAVMSDPPYANTTIGQGVANLPGMDALEQLLNAGMVIEDEQGVLHPQLAEQVPTLENGLWKLLPDGRMETTWRIRDGAVWHDGRSVTADDLAFTLRVGMEREVPAFNNAAYAWVERVAMLDSRALAVTWNRPYIEADTMFTRILAYPLPKHLLEAPYGEDKANFTQLAYWNREFVGAGPYRLREWVPGSHLLMTAFAQYVLGRPKVEELEVKFVPDPNTLMASMVAGAAELTLGRGLSIEQALQVRDHWPQGGFEITVNGWMTIFPQMLTPDPSIVGDVQFRRALLHAIDRQAMVDSLAAGLTTVAHSLLLPNESEYTSIAQRAVRYEYDPRRAAQLIEGLGYTRGGDGFYRDGRDQRLAVELRTVVTDIAQKSTLATADYWQQAGVQTEQLIIPAARQNDLPYRASFPGFQLFSNPNDLTAIPNFQSNKAPVPENNFVGRNLARYIDPAMDALVDGYLVTVPKRDRAEIVGRIVHEMSDQLHVVMPLFHNGQPTMLANRLTNITGGGRRSTQSWNAHLWDMR